MNNVKIQVRQKANCMKVQDAKLESKVKTYYDRSVAVENDHGFFCVLNSDIKK